MKYLTVALLMIGLITTNPAIAQQKNRNADKMPTQNQMRSQLQEAANELNKQIADLEKQLAEAKKNKEDEATISGLEDQLAMLKKQAAMMGNIGKSISNISANTYKKAIEEQNTDGKPEIDVERINALPKKPLTDAELALFVQKTFTAIDKNMPLTQKKNGNEIYNEINAKSKLPGETGFIAVQYWLAGSTDIAIWLLGKACLDDRSNADNLSNYASLLSMVGGEHLAIPILQNLNRRFPGNTTILNNLGQAWYGLGDMATASRFIDTTGQLVAGHPHASETESEIDESEGKTEESIESLKRSIKTDYTPEKEARLESKGVKLIYDDIEETGCSKAAGSAGSAQTLGTERFTQLIPDYPMEGGLNAATQSMAWSDFKQNVNAAREKLEAELKLMEARAKTYQEQLVKHPERLNPYNNRIYKTTNRKLTLLIEWGTDRILALTEKIYAAGDTISKWREEYNAALANTTSCGGRLELATSFNNKANTLHHQRNNEWIDFHQQYLGAQASLFLCAFTDRSLYEANIAKVKLAFLDLLYGLQCEFEVGCIPGDPQRPQGRHLPDFDEMNCQYKTELSIPYAQKLFSIKVECNKMTTQFDLKYVKGSLEENLANGKYHGTVQIEQKIGSDNIELGPIKLGGSKLSAGAGVEFTEGGIQDVFVTGTAITKAGPVTVAGAEARVSVITGSTSITGKGALNGISIK